MSEKGDLARRLLFEFKDLGAGFQVRQADVARQAAFDRIIEGSLSGEIPWKVLPSQIEGVDEEFHADVIVQSVSGKEIKLPVLFYATSYGWDKTHVYLHLGDRSGPCLNQYHEDIVRLAKEVHGIDNIGNY
ncbi:MAG: hypothetical protein CMH64_00910 [Nanoarchaeota archaeon]|nr:hypothetical protein [Nanoarchaeota archaeon]|tara:strand:- start:532 stop:924 length:393 start_codon:yes stop_codon:yes gene_type:complete